MAELKDSGNRREFETGAVRDMQEGKGRCDLIPWKEAWEVRQVIFDQVCGSQMGYTYQGKTMDGDNVYERDDPKECWFYLEKQFTELDRMFNDPRQDNEFTPFGRMNFIHDCFINMAAIFITYVYGRTMDDRHLESFKEDERKKMKSAVWACWSEAMREVSKHYEDGARKYSENNWRKGMDPKIYFDSAARHLLKWFDDWKDEPHDRAFVWNCLGGAYEARQEAHKIAMDNQQCKCVQKASEATMAVATGFDGHSVYDLDRHNYADNRNVFDSLKVYQSEKGFAEENLERAKGSGIV